MFVFKLSANGQLLDLNAPDSTTINITAEYFDMDQVIFLFNMTEYEMPNGVSVHLDSSYLSHHSCPKLIHSGLEFYLSTDYTRGNSH